MLRRSRGYVPEALTLPIAATQPLLACGAEQKATFCVARGDRAWVGHHIGDLEQFATLIALSGGDRALRADVCRRTGRWSRTICTLTTSRPVRAGARRRRARRGPAPPRPSRRVSGRARCHGAGGRGDLRRDRSRRRRHDLGRGAAGRRPARLSARRVAVAGADARRRGRHPPAVADGRGVAGRGVRLRSGLAGGGRLRSGPAGGGRLRSGLAGGGRLRSGPAGGGRLRSGLAGGAGPGPPLPRALVQTVSPGDWEAVGRIGRAPGCRR